MPVDQSKKDKDKDKPVADVEAPADELGGDVRGEAADAAADELEQTEDTDTAHGEISGVKFEFSKKRLDSVQFRRFMQRNRDIVALEYLFGIVQFETLLGALADEDGDTSEAQFNDLWTEIGKAAGQGN